MKPLSLERFSQTFRDHFEIDGNKPFCFILGSGASKESGIPDGREFCRIWWEEIRSWSPGERQACAKRQGVAEDFLKKFDDETYEAVSADYTDMYKLRFGDDPESGAAFLRRQMEGKTPSYGYYLLAGLLSQPGNRVVITTNFDSLLEDALFSVHPVRPLVIGHESLVPYMRFNGDTPTILKIHRDLRYDPKNITDELSETWQDLLKHELQEYTPVVIGYGGGDNTLMKVLRTVEPLHGLYWLKRSAPGKEIEQILDRHNGTWVKIDGFDKTMDTLYTQLGLKDIFRTMDDMFEQRKETCRQSVYRIQSSVSVSATPPDEAPELADLYSGAVADTKFGRWAEALAKWNELCKRQPEKAAHFHGRGITLHALGRDEEALPDRNRAIELSPDTAEYYYGRSVTLDALNRYAESLEDMNRAIELSPDTAEYYYGRGVTLYALNRYAESLEDRNRAIELSPDTAEYYYGRSVTLDALNRYAGSLEDSNRAIELSPDTAKYYYGRSVTLHALNRYEESLEDMNRAIELSPDTAEYYYGRSITLHALGRHKAAKADRARAAALDPDDPRYS